MSNPLIASSKESVRFAKLLAYIRGNGEVEAADAKGFEGFSWNETPPSVHELAFRPEAWFGPFEHLVPEVQEDIVASILARERAEHTGHELAERHPGLLRLLWQLKGPHWEHSESATKRERLRIETLSVLALGARRAPAAVLAGSTRLLGKLRGRLLSHPRLDDLFAWIDFDPRDLAVCYARKIPQDPPYRGYWHDPERNITIARLVGIDLQPSENGTYLIESNSNPGLDMRRSAAFRRHDPLAENLFHFAAERKYRRVLVAANNADGINPLLEKHFQVAAHRYGIELVIQNLHNVADNRYPRGWRLPTDLADGTLVLRIRRFYTAMDRILGSKQATYRALECYAAASNDPELKVPAFGLQPVLGDVDSDEPFPNLVYKLPDLGQQRGVIFFKVKNPQDAHAMLAAGLRKRLSEGLLDRLVQKTCRTPGLFQAYIRPRLLPGRRAYKVRALLLLSPVGHRMLAAHAHDSRIPVPDRLPFGLVEDPRPYLVGLHQSSDVRPLQPPEATEIEPAAMAVARGLAWAVEYGFVTGPE